MTWGYLTHLEIDITAPDYQLSLILLEVFLKTRDSVGIQVYWGCNVLVDKASIHWTEPEQAQPGAGQDFTHCNFLVSRPLRILAVSGRELGLTSLTLLSPPLTPQSRGEDRGTEKIRRPRFFLSSSSVSDKNPMPNFFFTADYLNLSSLYFSFLDTNKLMNEKHFS